MSESSEIAGFPGSQPRVTALVARVHLFVRPEYREPSTVLFRGCARLRCQERVEFRGRLRDPDQAHLPGLRPDQWTGRETTWPPGRDAARAGWLYGFQIVRARSIPPAKDQRASMPAMRRPRVAEAG